MIEEADYFIRLINLPPGVGGIVSPNPDGTYSMYLDARKSRFERIDDYAHELMHIERDDFNNDLTIDEAEAF